MMITMALILSVLVAFNFTLLLFSCNKYPKELPNMKSARVKTQAKPLIKDHQTTTTTTTRTRTTKLAATGS